MQMHEFIQFALANIDPDGWCQANHCEQRGSECSLTIFQQTAESLESADLCVLSLMTTQAITSYLECQLRFEEDGV